MSAEGATLSPQEAAAAVREVSGWMDALRSRTLGLVFLVWGIVAPATFLTYAYAASVLGAGAPFALLWIPWTVLGLAFTYLLWRSTGVGLERPVLTGQELRIHVSLFVVVILGSVVAIELLELPYYPTTAVLAAIGLATAALGVRALFEGTRGTGGIQVVAGLLLVLFAVGQAALHGGLSPTEGLAVTALWNAPASAIGLWTAGLARILGR